MNDVVTVRQPVDGGPEVEKSGIAAVARRAGVSGSGQRGQSRGLLWVVGSFAICPCHLPVTLALLTTVLGGTALGAALHQHIVLAGVIIAVVWLFGTWRGLRLLRQGSACAVRQSGRRRATVVRGFLGLPKR